MIVCRTPFRISLFGGGTDYPSWFKSHGGEVLAASIDKYCHINCRELPPFFDHRYRVVWSKNELCKTIDEISHPAVRAALNYMDINCGAEIFHIGDLPARSGIGSSSSFVVCLLHALHAMKGEMPSKRELALESIHIEQNVLQETVGSQDQFSAAYGGLNHIVFDKSGEISVYPMTLHRERIYELESHLMLFYTGIQRTASEIASEYVQDLEDKSRQLQMLSGAVKAATRILSEKQDIVQLGELLHETWLIKKSLSAKVSNPQIDDIYELARSAGAIGGKLTGAGGGGFFLLFVPPEKHPQVLSKLNKLIHIPFAIEYSGSQVIFYSSEKRSL